MIPKRIIEYDRPINLKADYVVANSTYDFACIFSDFLAATIVIKLYTVNLSIILIFINKFLFFDIVFTKPLHLYNKYKNHK